MGTLVSGMLDRSLGGHTDGHRPDQGTATATAGHAAALTQRVWRMVLGEDEAFAWWLRAVNDRFMRLQIEACEGILEAIEGMEDEEEGQQLQDAGPEAEGGRAAGSVDLQAYMTAWGLDDLRGGVGV